MVSMVRGYHLILTTYGFWLPNDPRGSWSTVVRAKGLRAFGEATKVDTTRSVADRHHDHHARKGAKRALARPPVVLRGEQAKAVMAGIAAQVEHSGYAIHAACILPDHVHLVIARHDYPIEQIANLIKGSASRQLRERGLHPFAGQPYANGKLPSIWARKHWAPFIETPKHMRAAIRYVEQNPIKAGHKPQRWSFTTPYPP